MLAHVCVILEMFVHALKEWLLIRQYELLRVGVLRRRGSQGSLKVKHSIRQIS